MRAHPPGWETGPIPPPSNRTWGGSESSSRELTPHRELCTTWRGTQRDQCPPAPPRLFVQRNELFNKRDLFGKPKFPRNNKVCLVNEQSFDLPQKFYRPSTHLSSFVGGGSEPDSHVASQQAYIEEFYILYIPQKIVLLPQKLFLHSPWVEALGL